MAECVCSCGWHGDAGDLVSVITDPGTDDVVIDLHHCPECEEKVFPGDGDFEDSMFDEADF